MEKVTRESEALEFMKIGEEIRKESRISYTREFLLSQAELDVCKELPHGFDQSILSELEDTFNGTDENQKLCGSGLLTSGRNLGDCAGEAPEKWGSCKLSSKDSNSTANLEKDAGPDTDSGRWHSSQSRQPLQNSGSVGSLRSSMQRRSGILGKWSDSKQSNEDSEGSSLKSQGTERSLLSRCKEPYRPPSFYKAMSDSGRKINDSYDKETFGSTKGPSKERVKDERWRKASLELVKNEQVIEEKQKSSQDQKDSSNTDACGLVKTCSDVPGLSNSSPCSTGETAVEYHGLEHVPQLPSKRTLVRQESEVLCYAEKLHEQIWDGGRFSALIDLKEADSSDSDLADEANVAAIDSFGGGQGVVVDNVEFAASKKKELRTHVSSFVESQETKVSDILPIDILPVNMENSAIKSSAVEVSGSPISFVKPSYIATSLPEASLPQEPKDFTSAGKQLEKRNIPLSAASHHSAVRGKLIDGSTSEIWQSPRCTQHHDILLEGRERCKSRSKFVGSFSENDKRSSSMPSCGEKKSKKVGEGSTGMLINENLIDQGLSKRTSFCALKAPAREVPKTNAPDSHNSCAFGGHTGFPRQSQLDKSTRDQDLGYASVAAFQITEVSELNPVCNLHEEADSNIELNLPDEDSLITIDDTFILQQDEPPPSPLISSAVGRTPSSRSNELLEPERLHQNLSWQDPWLVQSQLNSQKPFVNPSKSQARLRAPPIPSSQTSWNVYHNENNPFAAGVVPHPFGMLPVEAPKYEPPAQHFVSFGGRPAENVYPHFNNILPPEPSTYHHQVHQFPFYQQEPTPLGSLPLNYQRNVNSSMDVGKRVEEGNKSAFTRLIQMQMGLAHMNLEPMSAPEQRAYPAPIGNQFW